MSKAMVININREDILRKSCWKNPEKFYNFEYRDIYRAGDSDFQKLVVKYIFYIVKLKSGRLTQVRVSATETDFYPYLLFVFLLWDALKLIYS